MECGIAGALGVPVDGDLVEECGPVLGVKDFLSVSSVVKVNLWVEFFVFDQFFQSVSLVGVKNIFDRLVADFFEDWCGIFKLFYFVI
ncbi:hypothetical protein [Nocardiopsis ansamitocini]|uniref:hypothetical protein n=1 Tax=Nocardiopsis ansamitocini TaxID=1670832 RepID=UPI002553696E|nr:hypothetical protein [Nocardiopsis ansamitocini]